MSCKCGHLSSLSRQPCLCKEFICKCRNWALNSDNKCNVCAESDQVLQYSVKDVSINPEIKIVEGKNERTVDETEYVVKFKADEKEAMKNVHSLTDEIESTVKELKDKLNGSDIINTLPTDSAESDIIEALVDISTKLLNKTQELSCKVQEMNKTKSSGELKSTGKGN